MGQVARHSLIFAAALILVWLSVTLPSAIFRPGILAGLTPAQVFSESVDFGPEALPRLAPFLLIVAAAQWIVFRNIHGHQAAIFLPGVAVAWSAYAWFSLWFVFYR